MCNDEVFVGGVTMPSEQSPVDVADLNEPSFFPVIPGEYDETKPRFVPLSTQVAGHDGVLSDENGFVIIKPCTETEINFYERCLAEVPTLMDCVPAFMGTLELNTPETLASMAPEVAAAIPEDFNKQALDPAYSPPNAAYERAVVLENLAFGYSKPCILDLKLGAILHDEKAAPEKQKRLQAVSLATTSGSLGVRIAGMKVWMAQDNRYREYERNWGKGLTTESFLPHGLAEFMAARIHRQQKRLIVRRFLEDIARVIHTIDEIELRIYSPSLLLVYEGDQAALDLAIEDEGKQMIRDELGDNLLPKEGAETDEDAGDDGSEDSSLPEARDFSTCRLIDFAHARFTPGRGRDENLLGALKSARRLFHDLLDSEYL